MHFITYPHHQEKKINVKNYNHRTRKNKNNELYFFNRGRNLSLLKMHKDVELQNASTYI